MNEYAERREGLKALLRQVNRQATALDARDWRQAAHILARTDPDLLVIDWHSPTMHAQDLSSFMREHPRLPAAVLADDAAGAAVATFMHAGVLGVVPRDLAPRLIVRALELVMLGGHYIPACALDLDLPEAAPCKAYQAASIQTLPRRPNLDGPSPLSPRQHQIMRLVHLGNTNKVIARALGISEGTVKIHLASMFRLLGATNRAAAVAIYNGWQFDNLRVLDQKKPARASVASPRAASGKGAGTPPSTETDGAAAVPKPQATPHHDAFRHWLFAAEADVRYRSGSTRRPPDEDADSTTDDPCEHGDG